MDYGILVRVKRSLSRVLALFGTLVAASVAAQVALPTGVTAGPTYEGISEYRLANGLRVLLIPDNSVDTITSNIVYAVGSRHEGYGESGASGSWAGGRPPVSARVGLRGR